MSSWPAGKLNGPHVVGGDAGPNETPQVFDVDLESMYSTVREEIDQNMTMIVQNTQKLSMHEGLFDTDVLLENTLTVKGMIDCGSMACTVSPVVVSKLQDAGVALTDSVTPSHVALVGCGGSKTKPIGMCDINMTVYGCTVQVPTLVVDGQVDDIIVGSNVIKHLIKELKNRGELMKRMMSNVNKNSEDGELIQLLANVERWNGTVVPEKVGTVKLKNSVTLEPLKEHLVWAKLSNLNILSAGSAIIAEPCGARSRPRNILIGRTVAKL